MSHFISYQFLLSRCYDRYKLFWPLAKSLRNFQTYVLLEKSSCCPRTMDCYTGINLTSYHPPRLTPWPLIFPSKSPPPGQLFSAKLRLLGRKNEAKINTPGHNLPSANAKRSMKKEHNFKIKSSFFPIFP